jgi:hypothetical protein
MSKILRRFFNTFAVRSGSALFIRTRPDHNTPEQNRIQIANIMRNHTLLGSFNVVIALAQTVMIRPEDNNRLYVVGSPHIALAAFDGNMEIIEGCCVSKGMLTPRIVANSQYGNYEIVSQQYVTEARFQDLKNTSKHYLASPSFVQKSFSIYSNGKDSSKINNAGGEFYLTILPVFTERHRLMLSIQSLIAADKIYDRMNNNCGHAVLRSVGFRQNLPQELSTQGALELVLKYFSVPIPYDLPDLCKSPIELGFAESLFLSDKRQAGYQEESYKKHLRQYFDVIL